MDVSLTPELERMVHRKVKTGQYNSASEVVQEALRLMEERDQMKTIQKEELLKKIAAGLKSLEEDKGIDGEALFAQMDAELYGKILAEVEKSRKELMDSARK